MGVELSSLGKNSIYNFSKCNQEKISVSMKTA